MLYAQLKYGYKKARNGMQLQQNSDSIFFFGTDKVRLFYVCCRTQKEVASSSYDLKITEKEEKEKNLNKLTV